MDLDQLVEQAKECSNNSFDFDMGVDNLAALIRKEFYTPEIFSDELRYKVHEAELKIIADVLRSTSGMLAKLADKIGG